MKVGAFMHDFLKQLTDFGFMYESIKQLKHIPLTNRVRGPYCNLRTMAKFFPPSIYSRSALAINGRGGKNRIRNSQYELRKRA